jgi:DNA repair exonuclease SbcCD ATPase subunit
MYHDSDFREIEITPERIEGLKRILADVPAAEREEAARRLVRYLQIVIKIAHEADSTSESEDNRVERRESPAKSSVAKAEHSCPGCGQKLKGHSDK